MNIEIANRLVEYRKQRGMSQEDLASAIGISRQAVSKWERAEASPDTDNLIALARLYGVSLDSLLLAERGPVLSTVESPPEPDMGENGYHHERPPLSPAAMSLVKLCGVAAGVVLFLIYGFLSMLFPSLNGAYVVLCTIIYLVLGFMFQKWHPGWMIYLTVPLFYTMF